MTIATSFPSPSTPHLGPSGVSVPFETPTLRARRQIVAELTALGARPTDRAVYLLHLERPYPAGKQPQHYLGSARRLLQRLLQHWTSDRQGSPLIRAAVRARIAVHVVRVWPGGRQLERQLKRRRRHRVYCPCCQPAVTTPSTAEAPADVSSAAQRPSPRRPASPRSSHIV